MTGPVTCSGLMLDTKGTFDDLVLRYARTPEQAESILANRIYQNLSGALSGTQEYMAMEKLYELVHSEEFDIVVVDTPPTRNALDLLDAPRRLTRFLENRLFRAVLVPTRMSLRARSAWPPKRCCARSPRSPAPRSSRTRSASSRPSRGWKTASGAGPAPSTSCWPTRPRPTSSSPRPGPTPSPRPASSPRSWPNGTSPWRHSW